MGNDYIQITEDKWNCRVDEVEENEIQEFLDWLQGKREIDRMWCLER